MNFKLLIIFKAFRVSKFLLTEEFTCMAAIVELCATLGNRLLPVCLNLPGTDRIIVILNVRLLLWGVCRRGERGPRPSDKELFIYALFIAEAPKRNRAGPLEGTVGSYLNKIEKAGKRRGEQR